MSVYRLRAKQRGPVCSFCDRKAVYRGCGFTKFACMAHHPDLVARDRDQARRDAYESDGEFYAGVPR